MLGQISCKNIFFLLIDLAATSVFLLYHVHVQKTIYIYVYINIYVLSNESYDDRPI